MPEDGIPLVPLVIVAVLLAGAAMLLLSPFRRPPAPKTHKCPDCGQVISKKALMCPHCGRDGKLP